MHVQVSRTIVAAGSFGGLNGRRKRVRSLLLLKTLQFVEEGTSSAQGLKYIFTRTESVIPCMDATSSLLAGWLAYL